jgi:hypothetical protein
MRRQLIVLSLALCAVAPASAPPARAQVSIGIGLPNVSIGINLPVYPELVRVPGYPVYYAPRLGVNFFFYDGLYWVFLDDDWYASSWYNGPWYRVGPEYVPVYILRVPVRYYRHPPPYFRGWQTNAPPRWGEHWGDEWSRHRSGWDRWNRQSAPAPAPLPRYQRHYSGNRYPDVDQQQALQQRNYSYRPRDPVVRQTYEAQRGRPPAATPHRETRDEPQGRRPEPRGDERSNPPPSVQHGAPTAPAGQPQERGGGGREREAPSQRPPHREAPPAAEQRTQRPDQGAVEHRPPAAQPQERERGNADREAPSQPPPHKAGPPAVEQRPQQSGQGSVQHQQRPPSSGREGAAPERERAQPGQERGQGQDKESGHEKRGKADDHGQDQGR